MTYIRCFFIVAWVGVLGLIATTTFAATTPETPVIEKIQTIRGLLQILDGGDVGHKADNGDWVYQGERYIAMLEGKQVLEWVAHDDRPRIFVTYPEEPNARLMLLSIPRGASCVFYRVLELKDDGSVLLSDKFGNCGDSEDEGLRYKDGTWEIPLSMGTPKTRQLWRYRDGKVTLAGAPATKPDPEWEVRAKFEQSVPDAAQREALIRKHGSVTAAYRAWLTDRVESIDTKKFQDRPDDIAPILEAVCGKGNVLTEQGKISSTQTGEPRLGCKLCPAYTDDAGREPSIGTPIMGAFTDAGRTEALVDLAECEAHANSSGGSVLLRKEQSRWKRISYSPGLRTYACLTLRRTDGTDLFVCTTGDMFQGHLFSAVTAYSFTKRGVLENSKTRLITAMDNLSACRLGNGRLKAMEVREVQARDVNGDGKKDVVIDLSAAFARTSKREGDPCPTEEEVKSLKPKTYQLVYIFDGNALTASPDTNKALRAMDAERSDILGEQIDEQSARGFIEYWLKTSQENGKLDEAMNSYGDAMDFYKFGLVEKNFVRQDKQKYYSRWPKRKYELKSFKFSPGDRRHEAKVAIVFSYEIANDKKTLKGEAKAMMVLQSNDEGIRIVGEKEQ